MGGGGDENRRLRVFALSPLACVTGVQRGGRRKVKFEREVSLRSSLFRFLLAVESESRGEVARRHGARAKNIYLFFLPAVPVPSRDSRLPERKRKRLLRRKVATQASAKCEESIPRLKWL